MGTVVQLLKSYGWIGLLALVVFGLIRLSKGDPVVDWTPIFIRPANRPIWALGFGIVGGVLEQIVFAGTPLGAIAGGTVAGCMAIALHELVVNAIRKGRDIGTPPSSPPALHLEDEPAPSPPRSGGKFFPLVGSVLVLASCSACIIGAVDHPRREEPKPPRLVRADGGAE